jgi:glycosyltransferase involved in cell wall biosynthesis
MTELPEQVSVIMVVKNGERFIGKAIESILAQILPVAELIVVDGRSSDRTVEVANYFESVHVLQQQGKGLADARNTGIQAARHDWIAFLDHDDEWTPGKLQLQFAALRSSPGSLYTLGLLEFFVDGNEPLPQKHLPVKLNTPREGPTPGTLLSSRKVFETIGLFDERYSIGCDLEWIKRARDRKIPAAECREVVLRKRLHGGNLSLQAADNRREIFGILRDSLHRQS